MKIKEPIIFIGTGRSGSTVISGAVLSHRDLGYPSNYQQKFPSVLEVNLIRRLFDNRFWRFYTRGKQSGLLHKLIFLPSESYAMWKYLVGKKVDFSRGYLLNDKANKEEVALIHDYFAKMLRLQGKKRLAFKITGPARLGYLLSIFPDARFVYIKRKLVPTVSSFLKTNFWKTRGYKRLWFTGAHTPEAEAWAVENNDQPILLTAYQIDRLNKVTAEEIATHQPSIITHNYEGFTAKPREVLEQTLDFLGLDHDAACLDYLAQNPIYRNQKSDEDYFSSDELKAIRKVLDTIS